MASKYKILNFILFPVAIFAAFMNYETWSQSNGGAQEVAKKPEARLEDTSKAAAVPVKEEAKPLDFYSVIWGKNIFSPERKEFLLVAPIPPEQDKPAVRPQVTLYGVIIADDYQSACVSIPGRPLRKGERETMILKPGDRIGEYRLAKVLPDRVTIEAPGDSFGVLLHDPKNPKKRIEVKTEIKLSEAKSTQLAPGTLPAVETGKVEAIDKPKEPTQEKAITPASPLPGRVTFPPASIRRGRRPVPLPPKASADQQVNPPVGASGNESR